MKGQAFGDAIGLFTEFTTKEEAQKMIDGEPINFGPSYPKSFQFGWTDDTDQALCVLRAIYQTMTSSDQDLSSRLPHVFANELLKWRNWGLATEDPFMGRSKPYCMGLGALVASVLQEPGFLQNPVQSAEKVWAKNPQTSIQNRPAANGAIMRTAPIGLIFYRHFDDLISLTIQACQVTHADPRCTASCVALTLAIALSLRGYDSEAIFKGAEQGGLAVLRNELELAAKKKLLSNQECEHLDDLYETIAEEFKMHLHGSWETLDLDEGYNDPKRMNKIGYTFKCMGAAFYALTLASEYEKEGKVDIFRLIIEEIAGEGGDADTNGAAAGALIGAYLGLKGGFPLNWIRHLSDAPVLEQAIQHVEELSARHKKTA